MKDRVATESYVERWQREQKEKMGIPSDNETGIPVKSEMDILPIESDTENLDGIIVDTKMNESIETINDTSSNVAEQAEVKKHGKNTGSEGQATSAESGSGK